MARRFLNVEFGKKQTEIDVGSFERLAQVRSEIKKEFGADIDASAPSILLYNQQNVLIEDLDDVTAEYFKKKKDGGLFLKICIDHSPLMSHVSGKFSSSVSQLLTCVKARPHTAKENTLILTMFQTWLRSLIAR